MIVLAHRGSVEEGMHENTLDAFQLAKDKGAHGIETDVRLTKDKELVLFHNHSVGKRRIRDLTYKQLQARVGYKVPTLHDLLKWSSNTFMLNIEVKEFETVNAVGAELKRYPRRDIVVSSFHHPTAFKLARGLNMPCALLMPSRPIFIKPFFELIPAMLRYVIWDYDVYDPTYKSELALYEHWIYNVGELKPTKDKKADGIISDHLDIHIRTKPLKV